MMKVAKKKSKKEILENSQTGRRKVKKKKEEKNGKRFCTFYDDLYCFVLYCIVLTFTPSLAVFGIFQRFARLHKLFAARVCSGLSWLRGVSAVCRPLRAV